MVNDNNNNDNDGDVKKKIGSWTVPVDRITNT